MTVPVGSNSCYFSFLHISCLGRGHEIKNFTESHIRISAPASILCLWFIFLHFSEQFSELRGAFGKLLKQPFSRGLQGGFLELAFSVFISASRNFTLYLISHQRQAKIVKTTRKY
jgi:hypothetical protein